MRGIITPTGVASKSAWQSPNMNPNRPERWIMKLTQFEIDVITNVLCFTVILAVPVLGALVSRKRRTVFLLGIVVLGSPLGLANDMWAGGADDGPACGFIGMPLLFAFLFFVGVWVRAVLNWFFPSLAPPPEVPPSGFPVVFKEIP